MTATAASRAATRDDRILAQRATMARYIQQSVDSAPDFDPAIADGLVALFGGVRRAALGTGRSRAWREPISDGQHRASAGPAGDR